MKNIYLVVLSLLLSASISFGQNRVYAPELQTPENGVIDQMPQVLLNWYAVTGVGYNIQYEVQLSTDTAFTNPTEFPFTGLTALNAGNLMFGDVYYWHVRAHDGDEVSDWSETWSFSIITSVIITSPTDGSVVNPQVAIEWNQVTGADFYQILVDTSYSWKKEYTGISGDFNAAFVVDSNNYGGVGDDGLVFYYNGTWNVGESGTTKDLLYVYFVNANDGWAVGQSGTVIHFDGNAWSSVDIGATKELRGVFFADASNGWVVGKSGVIYYFDGTSWTEQTSGTTKDLNAVWAVSPTDVWAGGKSGTMVHFDGTAWSVDSPGSKDFMGLWFNSATDGWAIQKSGGLVSHYDGSTWTEENTGVSKVFFGIAFNGTEGYIVGQTGTLLEYNGEHWIKITSGTTKNINGIWFADGVGFYAGDGATAYTYTGGGFDSPYTTTYNVSGSETSFYLQNLFFGSTYYYKMRMGHGADTSAWSLAKSFQVQRTPVLSSPEDGASEIAMETKLDWKDFDGIQKFNVQISTNGDFSNALTYYADSSFFDIVGLSFGTQYYWRVNAQNAAATSPWSDPWTFTTTNTVALTAPVNNSVDIATCPLLEWETIPGVGTYEVWIDMDENFSNPQMKMENGSSSQCQSQLEKKTDYFWKVRGIFALDTSDWSPVWKFTTAGPDAIDEIVDPASLSIYPNPSKGHFTIQVNGLVDDKVKIEVADISGKVVYSESHKYSIGLNKITVDVNHLASGIYHVSIIKNNHSLTKKLLIK